MKLFVVICFLATVALAVGAPNKSGRYTDRYDNMNLDEILDNRRLLIPYIKCALDQARCSPEGKELKCEYFWQNYITHYLVPYCYF